MTEIKNYHYLIDLPYLIVKEISKNLSIIDLICIALSCKKLYNDRNKYLIFNPKDVVVRDLNTIINFHWESFRYNFEHAVEYRKECQLDTTMEIDGSKTPYPKEDTYQYDYIYNSTSSEFKVPPSVKNLNYTYELNTLKKLKDTNIEILQLPNINYGEIEKDTLPNQLKELSLPSFNQKIPPGFLPATLKVLRISDSNSFMPGSLPNGLEMLYLESRFISTIEDGILPDSLKFIRAPYSCINPTTVPPQLETILAYYPYSVNTLPSSLKTMYITGGINYSNLSKFNNLTTILSFPIQYLHLLPSNVTTLSLANLYPKSIDNQTIVLKPNQIPHTITDLSFSFLNIIIEPGSIPCTVRTLAICRLGIDFIEPGIIPIGVINLYGVQDPIIGGSIPNTVKNIQFQDYTHMLPPGIIPDSVESITMLNGAHKLLPGVLPLNLKRLKYDNGLIPDIDSNVLPTSLEKLSVFSYHAIKIKISKDAFVETKEGEKTARLHLCTSLDIFGHQLIKNLPTAIQSITIKYDNDRRPKLDLRRINDDLFIGNSIFSGGFATSEQFQIEAQRILKTGYK